MVAFKGAGPGCHTCKAVSSTDDPPPPTSSTSCLRTHGLGCCISPGTRGDCTHFKVGGLLPHGTLVIPSSPSHNPSLPTDTSHSCYHFPDPFPLQSQVEVESTPKGPLGTVVWKQYGPTDLGSCSPESQGIMPVSGPVPLLWVSPA